MFYDAQEEAFAPRGLPVPYRKTLPFLRNPNQKINIWRVVKDSIGKELSKMAVPVYFNEPISFLQRFSEDLLYHDLLIRAATEQDAGMRIALIACFAVSGYSVIATCFHLIINLMWKWGHKTDHINSPFMTLS